MRVLNPQEKKILELTLDIYRVAKELDPELSYLDISINLADFDDGFPPEHNAIHVNNNYWQDSAAGKIDFWGDLE